MTRTSPPVVGSTRVVNADRAPRVDGRRAGRVVAGQELKAGERHEDLVKEPVAARAGVGAPAAAIASGPRPRQSPWQNALGQGLGPVDDDVDRALAGRRGGFERGFVRDHEEPSSVGAR